MDSLENFYDKQKQAAGTFAMILWLGVGIYLFAINDQASFLSWQAAFYFIGGMFASALVLGIGVYAVQRGVTKVLLRVFSGTSAGVAMIIQGIGKALMIAEAVAIYFIADWVISSFLYPA